MMRFLLFVVSIAFLFSSCANKFSVQKRKYTKGYYYASSGKSDPKKAGKELNDNIIISSHEEVPVEEVAVNSFKEEAVDNSINAIASEEKSAGVSETKKTAEISSSKIKPTSHSEKKSSLKTNNSSKSPILYDIFSGGGFYAVFGLISAIISLLIALYYIFIIVSAFSGGSASAGAFGILVIVGVVLIAAVIIGVLLVNSD